MIPKKILIVEDDYLITYLMESYVNDFKFEVLGTATNCEEALKIVKQEVPDFVIMDVRIEGDKDGIDTALLINEIANVPIIYATGNNDPRTLRRAAETNIKGFLVKPINKDDLLRLLL
jgi:YesN/AraC family two-component response regulator